MAKPTRKQPDRRKTAAANAARSKTGTAKGTTARKRQGASRPNILFRAASGMMRLALRNPAIFGGSAAFAVVFGFVAANALWYQPGNHPSPLLRTRLPLTHPDPARVSLSDPQTVPDPSKVTTFVIRREDEVADMEPGAVGAEGRPTGERTASVPLHDTLATLPGEPAPRPDTTPDLDPTTLVRAVQTELARHGFYDGEADGRLGPKTTAAIRRFEQASGRPQTGIVSQGLLAALLGGTSAPSGIATITPAPRPTAIPPSSKPTGTTAEVDPVAAAIRAAEGGAEAKPRHAPASPKATQTASAESGTATPGGAGMVMTIQRGLSNLAYADVSIDGVAGDQTRLAIRHFEKHYRLPETGEPSPAVLKKMKEIGAI